MKVTHYLSVTKGGTSAHVEASVLSLYDNSRLRGPKQVHGEEKKISWEDLDKKIVQQTSELLVKVVRFVL
ncbi:MAG: hypothetical protein QM762_30425 [Chryseolinea sp.]